LLQLTPLKFETPPRPPFTDVVSPSELGKFTGSS
jgi:hypothetical protein